MHKDPIVKSPHITITPRPASKIAYVHMALPPFPISRFVTTCLRKRPLVSIKFCDIRITCFLSLSRAPAQALLRDRALQIAQTGALRVAGIGYVREVEGTQRAAPPLRQKHLARVGLFLPRGQLPCLFPRFRLFLPILYRETDTRATPNAKARRIYIRRAFRFYTPRSRSACSSFSSARFSMRDT